MTEGRSSIGVFRRVVISVFTLLPFAVALGIFAVFLVPNLHDAMRAASWRAVPAKVLSLDVETVRHVGGRMRRLYRIDVRYAYTFKEQPFEGDKIAPGLAVYSGWTDRSRARHRRLKAALARDTEIEIWVDPSDPAESMITRAVEWEIAAAALTGSLVFLLWGVYLLPGNWRKLSRTVDPLAAPAGSPWRDNPDWSQGLVLFREDEKLRKIWFLALLLLLMSWFGPVIAWAELEKGNWGILGVLLFFIIGLGFLTAAVHKTLGIRRFGKLALAMDPFPGSLGGDVAGFVDLKFPYVSGQRFRATLTCLRTTVKKSSGGSRSRHDMVLWEQNIAAQAYPSTTGARLTFKFEPPPDLPASEPKSDNYHRWTLGLDAELPGVDLDRVTDVPVYDTGHRRTSLGVKSDPGLPEFAPIPPSVARFEPVPDGILVTCSAPRSIRLGLINFAFAAVCVGGPGFFLYRFPDDAGFPIFMLLFTVPVACFLVGFGLILIGGTLRATVTGGGVETIQYLFGLPVRRRRAEAADVSAVETDIDHSEFYGGRQRPTWKVVARLQGRNSIKLADSICDSRLADLVRDRIAAASRLKGRDGGD